MKKINHVEKLKDGKCWEKLFELLEKAPGYQEVEPLFDILSDRYEEHIRPAWMKGNNENVNGIVNEFNDLLIDYALAAQKNSFNAGVEYGLKQVRK